ncbi:MAG: radical SAM family heme chaperone HemW, partial [Bacteroidota bacterium]|nr:radical SAM family heme chaperone HemW [Bacteroidota bacterium]
MSGLYIHIPFCKKACNYCNFHFTVSQKSKTEFIKAIVKEIHDKRNYLGNDELETIYFGGGTPSTLEIKELELIFESINENFKIAENAEITIETNPDDLDLEKLTEYKKLGINRLSIGVQSFNNKDLEFTARVHSSTDAIESIKNAQKVGFKNITIDLIYGIPDSDKDRWENNLNKIIALDIPHFSAYALTVEPKTILEYQIRKGVQKDVDEELVREQYFQLVEFAKSNNFIHYEISNFGKNDFFSIHNSNYWKSKKYLGVGPSAHSYDLKSRQWNTNNNTEYIKKINSKEKYFETEILDSADKFNEYLMLSLRTIWGVDLDKLFSISNNFNREKFDNKIEYFQNMDFIFREGNKIKLTDEGTLFSDG